MKRIVFCLLFGQMILGSEQEEREQRVRNWVDAQQGEGNYRLGVLASQLHATHAACVDQVGKVDHKKEQHEQAVQYLNNFLTQAQEIERRMDPRFRQ